MSETKSQPDKEQASQKVQSLRNLLTRIWNVACKVVGQLKRCLFPFFRWLVWGIKLALVLGVVLLWWLVRGGGVAGTEDMQPFPKTCTSHPDSMCPHGRIFSH